MFQKIITGIKKFNISQEAKMAQLKELKCDSIFETFKNVCSYNDLLAVKKEIKSIKVKKKKPQPEIAEAKMSLLKDLEKAKTLPKEERDLERARISQKAFKYKLKQKKINNKKITKLEGACYKNPLTRKKVDFLKKGLFASPLLLYINKGDIKDANSELGTLAAIEEIDKTTFMAIFGLGAVRYASKQAQNITTTAAIYSPKAPCCIKFSGVFAAIFAGMSVKFLFDKLWQTEYEKTKQ